MSTLAFTDTHDESAFTALVQQYRRGVQAHCYRMLGSHEDAEDMTQETFLRAWRGRKSFQGRSSFRTWLYRIATNTCLTALERSGRRPTAHWPDVDSTLPHPEGMYATTDDAPDAQIVSKETIDLFLVAVRDLPPRQRTVLFLRDVVGCSARETAEFVETSVAAVNSALHRARPAAREQLSSRGVEVT